MLYKLTLQPYASRLVLLISKLLTAEYVLSFCLWYVTADGLKDKSGTPLGADFLNVYAAGLMVHQGQAASVYNWDLHGQIEQTVAGYAAPYFGWHYPPNFLSIANLCAYFPYLCAFGLYMTISFVCYVTVIRRISAKLKECLWALVAFPGVFVNIINGQNGFLTTAFFGAGMMWLEEKPWLAGVMFGLLSYKPQFFIVIPVVLALSGYARACFSTLVTAGACFGLSWLAYGSQTWQAFFQSTRLTQHIILERGVTGWQKIQSIFSIIRMWDGSVSLAYTLQALSAVSALALTLWIWHRKANLAIRATALCGCILLTTPYVLDYDLVILAIPLAFLTREGLQKGFIAYEKVMMLSLWILPLLARNLGNHFISLTPPILISMMVFCFIKTRQEKI
jgi:hypothetical protein